ncbi:MAG: hypothetical protein V1834_00080 [Candidatus Micrarchaeota archaeon]
MKAFFSFELILSIAALLIVLLACVFAVSSKAGAVAFEQKHAAEKLEALLYADGLVKTGVVAEPAEPGGERICVSRLVLREEPVATEVCK